MTDNNNQIRITEDAFEIEQTLVRYAPLFSRLNESGIRELAEKYSKHGKVILFGEDNENCGFAAFYCNNANDKVAYLSLIATAEDMQRKGIGKRLIDEVQRISAEAGMEKLRLEVNNANSKAISFYIKNGFRLEKPASEHTQYLIKNI